ncbi:hypothetical protein GDO86_019127 [Hymenochirus boettgeri]|uniref:Caspase family p10 domain-containing protein n=1 Tax=Hymenochirus boettgeri TaxID=247094 RepID=A0A8T2ID85_9PIPI|nr:hypothetical protein GDO86_019127 [Hymenochirus boettgeri]
MGCVSITGISSLLPSCLVVFIEEADRGVDQRDGREQMTSPGCEQSDAGREEMKIRLPTQSDMICAFSCLKGTVSLRNTKKGSWFVQALASVFSQNAKDTHVADMLVKVNSMIKEREGYAPGTEFHRSATGPGSFHSMWPDIPTLRGVCQTRLSKSILGIGAIFKPCACPANMGLCKIQKFRTTFLLPETKAPWVGLGWVAENHRGSTCH